MIQSKERGRPQSPRVKVSEQLLRSLENVFRVFVACRDEEDVYDVRLKNWVEEAPALNRGLYETIPWQSLAAVYVADALSERQSKEEWRLPDWSTFKRHIVKCPAGEVGIEPMEDFLFIARALIKQIEWNRSNYVRNVYARRAMHKLRPDVETIVKKVGTEKRRLERVEKENYLRSKGQNIPNGRSKLRGFARRCGELASGLPLDSLYVPLTLITDERAAHGNRESNKDRYDELLDVIEDAADLPLHVLLGAPGSGKSTLMLRLYAQKLWEASGQTESLIPIFVTLGSSTARKDSGPEALLSEAWERAYGTDLAPYRQVADAGKITLLLDGFNEGSAAGAAAEWRAFLLERFLNVPGNRAVVSCRALDYTLPLGTDAVRVPHIRIAPLDPRGIAKYLHLASPKNEKILLNTILADPALTTLYGSPFFLSALVGDGDVVHGVDSGRTGLLARLAWRLLHRGYARDPVAFGNPLFTEVDRARITHSSEFNTTTKLPDQGVFIAFLSELAFAMGTHTNVEVGEAEWSAARASLPEAASCIKTACATGLLSLDFQEWALSFAHQLLQEFFAANKIAKDGAEERMWRLHWRKDEFPRNESQSLQEELPSLPSTGWEEATVMAAALSRDQEGFVSRVFAVNPLLAGRCVNASDVNVSNELHGQIQGKLHEIKHSEEADFRARLAAGLLMTDLERLGYERRTSPSPHLLPPSVPIEAGSYPIGAPLESGSGLKWHAIQFILDEDVVPLKAFEMCCYHVTNGEFALFIAAGGYENPDFWPDGDARRWLDGEGLFKDQLRQLEANIQTHLGWGGANFIESQIGPRWNAEEAKLMIAMLGWTAEHKEAWLREQEEQFGNPRHPALWFNPDFNAPTQPVVSVSWYEATAYCRWLSALTGNTYRLPAELEYEAVARGLMGRTVPYGSEPDPKRSNLRPSLIWRQAPVGLYPEGQFRGIHDLIGNVWTWTNSFDPPVGEGDQGRRVTRGGSYDTPLDLAKAFFRDSNHPGYRDRYTGFRMVREVSHFD